MNGAATEGTSSVMHVENYGIPVKQTQGKAFPALHITVLRAAAVLAVVAVHAVLGWTLVTNTRTHDLTAPVFRVLYARMIETNNPALVNDLPAPKVDAPAILDDLTESMTLLPASAPIALASANEAAIHVAPRLLDGAQPPVADFARRGGLGTGETAFVVLRLQIIPGGRVSDVAVDVSSGTRQVDEAACAYGRATHWVAGRTGNLETPTWIRLGVRLVA